MTTMYDVPNSKLIKLASEELKKIDTIKPTPWAKFVKTGGNREVQPEDTEWWYIRSASVLRKVHIKGPIGVNRLRKIYGGKKNRGLKPEAFRRGSGTILKNILKQLEGANLVKKTKGGRITTPKGISFLDNLAYKIKKETPELEKY